MIEKENKKMANRGEFLQGGEPPLIGRARSSQKNIPFWFIFCRQWNYIFSSPHSHYVSFPIIAVFFLAYPPLMYFDMISAW